MTATMATANSATNESFVDYTRTINGAAQAVWHKSAPKSVRRAFCAGNLSDGWAAWKEHLAKRKRPADPAKLLPGKGEPLGWALPDGLDSRPGPLWLDRAEGVLQGRQPPDPALERDLLGWLGESAGGAAEPGYALQALACCHAINRLAAVLSPEVWWALLEHLLSTVADAGGIDLDEGPLAHQLLAGELPLTLAYLLPEITPCRRLKSAARRALSSGPVDLLDGEGLPHGRHLALLRPLLACWTRCRGLGDQLKGGCWSAAAEEQYQWLVRQTLRLVRHDGTQVLSDGSAGGWDEELFKAALQFGGDKDDRNIAALVLPRRKKPGKKRIGRSALPEPAIHSEWAATAVLRPQWSRCGERLTVLYPERSVQMELACGKDVLWSGRWELDVRFDGKPAEPAGDWEQVCWVSDEDVDFLELEIELGGPLRVQRQMVLAREDRFLLLADVVLCDRPGKLEYRGCLPLCPGVCFRQADQSREGFLAGGKRRALALPLALPEWQADRRIGELSQTRRGLELRQSADCRGLYAPLFFDLDRLRMTCPPTWRQLTVAALLASQPADVAVGYRVAVGRQQWLIYRSLAEKANRTLLGHNLSSEMLVASFDRSGEVVPLLEIE